MTTLGAKFTVTLEREFPRIDWINMFHNLSLYSSASNDAATSLMEQWVGRKPTYVRREDFTWIAIASFTFDNLEDATLFKLRWGGQ